MKKWTNAYAPLYDYAGMKLTTIPEKAVVESGSLQESFRGVPRELVIYQAATRKYTGFVYVGFLEPYVENYATDCVWIGNMTEDPTDAAQYVTLYGSKQTNLCGELCAAFLLHIPLEDLVAEWEREKPDIYRRVFDWFGSKKAGGTGVGDLRSMLDAFETPSHPLYAAMFDPILNRSRYTVEGLLRVAGRAVVSVHIDGRTGRLKPAGVLHWVVVENVEPERAGYGFVTIYNPFPNRIEVYSWSDFIASAGVPSGVVVNG